MLLFHAMYVMDSVNYINLVLYPTVLFKSQMIYLMARTYAASLPSSFRIHPDSWLERMKDRLGRSTVMD